MIMIVQSDANQESRAWTQDHPLGDELAELSLMGSSLTLLFVAIDIMYILSAFHFSQLPVRSYHSQQLKGRWQPPAHLPLSESVPRSGAGWVVWPMVPSAGCLTSHLFFQSDSSTVPVRGGFVFLSLESGWVSHSVYQKRIAQKKHCGKEKAMWLPPCPLQL